MSYCKNHPFFVRPLLLSLLLRCIFARTESLGRPVQKKQAPSYNRSSNAVTTPWLVTDGHTLDGVESNDVYTHSICSSLTNSLVFNKKFFQNYFYFYFIFFAQIIEGHGGMCACESNMLNGKNKILHFSRKKCF